MRLLRALFLALVAAAFPAGASAHVVFAEPEARAASYYAGFLRVSHGCGESPTVSLKVEIPDAIVIARPQPKPGWTLAVETAPLAQSMAGEGGSVIGRRVVAVTWTGQLPIDQFDQFGLMLKLPASAGPLYFPAVQRCRTGENRWTEIPAQPDRWRELKRPAPMLVVTAAGAVEHKH